MTFRFVIFTQVPERIVSDGRGGLVGIGADGVEEAQDAPGVSGMTFKPFDDEAGTLVGNGLQRVLADEDDDIDWGINNG